MPACMEFWQKIILETDLSKLMFIFPTCILHNSQNTNIIRFITKID